MNRMRYLALLLIFLTSCNQCPAFAADTVLWNSVVFTSQKQSLMEKNIRKGEKYYVKGKPAKLVKACEYVPTGSLTTLQKEEDKDKNGDTDWVTVNVLTNELIVKPTVIKEVEYVGPSG